ncbi:uncharacterized protein LOC141912855 [Tubulanus polymorphus]|uniref:uncharacterized protein LOC141912855 n=1 Tax=Tubulanus polymorphus TaxID=672921 RepID=UPI003DA65042
MVTVAHILLLMLSVTNVTCSSFVHYRLIIFENTIIPEFEPEDKTTTGETWIGCAKRCRDDCEGVSYVMAATHSLGTCTVHKSFLSLPYFIPTQLQPTDKRYYIALKDTSRLFTIGNVWYGVLGRTKTCAEAFDLCIKKHHQNGFHLDRSINVPRLAVVSSFDNLSKTGLKDQLDVHFPHHMSYIWVAAAENATTCNVLSLSRARNYTWNFWYKQNVTLARGGTASQPHLCLRLP